MTALIVFCCIIAGIVALYAVIVFCALIIGVITVGVEARRAAKRRKAFRAKFIAQGAPFRAMETRIRPRNLIVSI